jgi:hypothetical protein
LFLNNFDKANLNRLFTDAALAILTGDESFVTDAIITCVRVDALAILTDSLLLTLVRLTALVRILISFLTGWTFAAK